MPGDPPAISLDDIVPILLEELRYEKNLPAKAFHKVAYFIHQSIGENSDLESDIELFWYKYGTCVRTSDAQGVSIRKTGGANEVVFHQDQLEQELDETSRKDVKQAVSDAVSMYYRMGLEKITDKQYGQAPHKAQKHYRDLDREIQNTISSSGKETTYFNRQKLRRLLTNFVNTFPTDHFPDLRGPLMQTQSLVSERLDNENAVVGDIDEILDTFWSLFCVDLAVKTATNVNADKILRDLQIGQPAEKKEKLRRDLDRYESNLLHISKDGPAITSASDAVMASRLDFEKVASDD